jgi:hypothetical protein
MTKLEELKAAYDAAYEAWRDASYLEAYCDGAWVVYGSAHGALNAASAAYYAELKKIQEENSND